MHLGKPSKGPRRRSSTPLWWWCQLSLKRSAENSRLQLGVKSVTKHFPTFATVGLHRAYPWA